MERNHDLNVSCPKSAKIDAEKKRIGGQALFTIRGIHKNRLFPSTTH